MTTVDLLHGTVLSGDSPADEVATLVLSRPEARPDGIRLHTAIPPGGPLVTVPAQREADELPVRLVLVSAELDASLRRRIRVECAELEAILASIDPEVILPLLDHGLDPTDRPYLLLATPPGSAEVPPRELDAALRATVEGLRLLAEQGLVGPPPAVYRTGARRYVLDTPLPPVLVELVAALGPRTGYEPPEVLAGGQWTPAGQAYACAAALLPLAEDGSPVREVLRRAISVDPGQRYENPVALASALPVATDPLPVMVGGRPLGSLYLLDRIIGRGATGVVWAGQRREDGAAIAVKLLRGELAEDPEIVTRFLRERTVLVRLRHPHLVQVHDLVAEGDVLGIVMDLVPGEDLRRLAARGRLDPAEAAGLLAQVADALAAVHAAGLVHRDVKPENVLITEQDGRKVALLSDFGIARAVEGSAHTEMIGTPAYVAPELVAGRPPGQTVDVYALGVTAYELMTGRAPFAAASTAALLQAHLDRPVPRPDGVSDEVWDLLAACLAKRPENRPGAPEVAFRWHRLAHASNDEPLLPAASPSTVDTARSARPLPVPPEEKPPRPRRRRLVALIAALALLGLSGGAAIAFVQRPGAGRPAGTGGTPAATGPPAYLVPATAAVTGASVRVSWTGGANLPGLTAFIVLDEQGRPVSQALPPDATWYVRPAPKPGERACFLVLAYGVTSPPIDPPPPPACVTR